MSGTQTGFDSRSGQVNSSLYQNKTSQPSSGKSDTEAHSSTSAGDTYAVKVSSADLDQNKASQSAVGSGETLTFNSASADTTQTAKTAPAHEWSAAEIAWAADFARKAVGSMVLGQAHSQTLSSAVDDGHGGTVKQVHTGSPQAFTWWSGKGGSDSNPAWTDGSTSDHVGKTSLTSTDTVDHVSAEHAQTVDLQQGYGLTGFEV